MKLVPIIALACGVWMCAVVALVPTGKAVERRTPSGASQERATTTGEATAATELRGVRMPASGASGGSAATAQGAGALAGPPAPTYSNPSVAGLELLIGDPIRFEVTVDTFAAWIGTLPAGMAFPDLARAAWAADPDGCAETWGVMQRARAIQDAFSRYEAAQFDRRRAGLAPEPAEIVFAALLPEIEPRADGDVFSMLQELSAQVQIAGWAYGEEEERVQRAAEWLRVRIDPQTKDSK